MVRHQMNANSRLPQAKNRIIVIGTGLELDQAVVALNIILIGVLFVKKWH